MQSLMCSVKRVTCRAACQHKLRLLHLHFHGILITGCPEEHSEVQDYERMLSGCHAWLSYAMQLPPTILTWNLHQKRSRQKKQSHSAFQAFSQTVPWNEGPQLVCTAQAENISLSFTCQGSESMPRGYKRLQPDPSPVQGGVAGWEGQRFPKSNVSVKLGSAGNQLRVASC